MLYLCVTDFAINEVLFKEQEKVEKSIYYIGKTLLSTETSYLSIERLGLVLVYDSQRCWPYFLAQKIVVLMDQPLK